MRFENYYGVELPEVIYVQLEQRGNIVRGEAKTLQYIIQKTNQLREFGYNDLKEREVAEQLKNIIENGHLNVIGLMMESDIIRESRKVK